MNTFSNKVVHKIITNRSLDMSHARVSSKVDGHVKLNGPEEVKGRLDHPVELILAVHCGPRR